MSQENNVLLTAQFHPVLKTYFFLMGIGWSIIIIFGIPFIPIWLIIGYYFADRYYKSLECQLTERTLELKKGHLFHIEKTIPLDKIQDITLREGPVLRALNICMLEIETAGQSNPQGSSDAKITGIVDAKEFRNRVLAQRDKVTEREQASSSQNTNLANSGNVLFEIRDSLKNIERLLAK
ncbi:PH domain-containing protein [candidate division KSB1 bacterium]|nr:PH domain-containing protein [candidate division KSB1 bacterium]